MGALFDDLVGAGEQGRRDSYAERLGGLEVAHQLDFGGLLDCEIGGLRALENWQFFRPEVYIIELE
jgi:hypothetical protein